MHSSRMRTVRCGGGPWEGALPAKGGDVCPGDVCLPPPCEQNDRHVLKHYLAATTLHTVTIWF